MLLPVALAVDEFLVRLIDAILLLLPLLRAMVMLDENEDRRRADRCCLGDEPSSSSCLLYREAIAPICTLWMIDRLRLLLDGMVGGVVDAMQWVQCDAL